MPSNKIESPILNTVDKPIHREADSSHAIAIYARGNLRWMCFDDTEVQSIYDISRPWDPVAPYCKSMLFALCLRPEPAQVLNLGMGGGTFERFFSEKLPQSAMTTVESSAAVIALNKRFFALPETAKVIQDSARHFTKSSQEKFDIILIDLFDAKGHLKDIEEHSFYRELASITVDSSLVVIDIAPINEEELLSILIAIRKVFCHVMLAAGFESANMVLICSRKPFPTPESTLNRAQHLLDNWSIDLRDEIEKFELLPQPTP